ncbi:MAG: YgjV family protein [Oscillospiraceae bacterium]|nr:YgjV family protein [Oscillospiraceae bacterium]
MSYIIGQALGALSTLCAVFRPFCKKKWQILMLNAAINLLVASNYILIGRFGSASVLCLLAIVQSVVGAIHDRRGTRPPKWEIVLFTVLYVTVGLLGIVTAPAFVLEFSAANALELMPIAGSMLMMAALFAPEPQTIRKFLLANSLIWVTYAILQGSSTFMTNAVSGMASAAALWKYRKQS